MLQCHRQVGHAHQCIRPRGVYAQCRAVGEGEVEVDTLGAANPVALHGAHLLWPLIQCVQVRQQLFGVVGDLDEPLVDFTALDRVVTAPATAVHHLFVGQHGLVGLAPVHLGFLLVGQALFKQAGEKPLFPAVVAWVAGCQFPIPVVGEAKPPQLLAHVINILCRPLRRRHLVLDGRVFSGQAEGVPAHRLQYILTLHALVARDYVGNGVVAHMAHMQLAAGVGKHGEAVELLPRVILLYGKAVVGQPVLLRGLFESLWVVLLIHCGVRVASLVSAGKSVGAGPGGRPSRAKMKGGF